MSSRGELQFPHRQLVEETAALRNMAADLLAPDGNQVLAELGGQIDAIKRSVGALHEIRLRPLCTRPTRDYEPGSRSGGSKIYAKLKGIWEVRSLGGKGAKTKVSFTGKASTVVELWPAERLDGRENEETSRLGMWRIELGAADSPGCYFHVQILGDRDAPPFPKRVPIPRLPSPFVTPMAAVEFVLGELFQDNWERRAGADGHHQKRWRAIQHQRWLCLLDWQKSVLQNGGSSPWMNLKAAKPPADLFLQN